MIATANGKEENYTVVYECFASARIGRIIQRTAVEVCGGGTAGCSWHSESDHRRFGG